MKAFFWGTRGSLPASFLSEQIRLKLRHVLRLAQNQGLKTQEAIDSFIDRLPFPLQGTYGTNTSCVEIQGGCETIICDAGTGIRDFGQALVKESGGPFRHVFHLFLSHLHWDHIQGFPFFIPAYIPGNRIIVYGGHGELKSAFETQQSVLSFPVSLESMAADITFQILDPDRSYEIAGVDVRMMAQKHPGSSFGYRFTHAGKTIVYSTDSEHGNDCYDPDYPFTEFSRDADILIFDAQYHHGDAIYTKENWGHSSNLIGVELAVRANVRQLVLFHNDHTADDVALENYLQGTRQYLYHHSPDSRMDVHLAYDGLCLSTDLP